MTFNFFVRSFKVASQLVEPPQEGVIVFAGPNNSGKTRALFGITQTLKTEIPQPIVHDVMVEKVGTTSDLRTWLADNFTAIMGNVANNSDPQFIGYGDQGVHADELEAYWEGQRSLGALGSLLIEEAPVEKRLAYYDDPQGTRRFNPKNKNDRPRILSHVLLGNRSLEQDVFETASILFGGEGLTVGRNSEGGVVELFGSNLLSSKAAPEPDEEWTVNPTNYQHLRDQGSGIRASVSLLNMLKATKSVVIAIDEPELFLHPPLAFKIGQIIAEVGKERQIFVATHSASLMNGIVAGGCPVMILRFTKSTETKSIGITEISQQSVKTLWQDARMRYAGIAEGTFHDAAILCENNRDCMFYAAAIDHYFSTVGLRQPELLFVDCSGKNALHTFMRPLIEMCVPVLCIADFDYLLLEDYGGKNYLKSMCDLRGIEWEQVKTRLSGTVGKSERNTAKRSGISGLSADNPNASAAIETVIAELRAVGVFVLRTGELESFAQDISNEDKGAWFRFAMDSQVFRRELPQELAKEVINALGKLVG